jgi:hypothetical protein
MSDTIYARVGPELKEATDQYAKGHGMSLASGVSELLSRGLEAAENESSIRVLEQRTYELQSELARVRDAAVALDGRLGQVLGNCECGQSLTGHDFLVAGRCPKCQQGVAGLMAGNESGGGSVNRNEFAPFMAGIGVTLAIIILAYSASSQ